MEYLRGVIAAATRKKLISSSKQSTLVRCLSTADLSYVGIGCMLGSGVYILTGEVAAEMAGPAAIISFFIAGVVALFSALCYTECATRYPETGASYLYAYVTMGELTGFVIGWNAIIIRVLAVSFVSRGWSAYFDNVIGSRASNFTVDVLLDGDSWDVPLISSSPDLIAGLVSFAACVLVAVGTELSAKASRVFVVVNVATIVMVIAVAFVYADFSNVIHHGRFAPMGFEGVIKGAAASFSGNCGFEAIAFAAEEAKDPKKGLPISIGLSFGVAILCYMGGVFAITILASWQEINSASPFVSAFEAVGATWMSIVVAVGALCSMTGGVIACAFCFARAIFVMGRDGLIPAIFAQVASSSHTPTIATIVGGILAIVASVFVNFMTLIEFLSLVIFVEFLTVAMACILMRYDPTLSRPIRASTQTRNEDRGEDSPTTTFVNIISNGGNYECSNGDARTSLTIPPNLKNAKTSAIKSSRSNGKVQNCKEEQNAMEEGLSNGTQNKIFCPTKQTQDGHHGRYSNSINNERTPLLRLPTTPQDSLFKTYSRRLSLSSIKRCMKDNPVSVVLISLLLLIMGVTIAVSLISYRMDQIKSGDGLVICILLLAIMFAVMACVPLYLLEQYSDGIPFKVPLMPFLPIVSILFDIILMVRFAPLTWIELGAWTAIGLGVYFTYGMRHSKEVGRTQRGRGGYAQVS